MELKKFAKDVKSKVRRRSVIERLEKQLISGLKTEKGDGLSKVKLTENDIYRIKKEIETLKNRIV